MNPPFGAIFGIVNFSSFGLHPHSAVGDSVVVTEGSFFFVLGKCSGTV